jgi:hypothetical protein
MSNARKLADLLDSAGDIKAAHLDNVVDALPLAGGTMTGNIAHGGAFTIDAVGDISLDSEGAILIKNGGSAIGRISNSGSDMIIKSDTSDKDILFKGNDGGSTIEAMRIDMSAGGNVGIGTDDPDGKLHIKGGASGSSYSADGADKLIIENNDSVAIDVRCPSGNQALIMFSDGTRSQGLIGYNHSNDSLRFSNSGNLERMRIDSSGNVGIAKSALTTWSSGYNALQVGGRGFVGAHSSSDLYVGQNASFNSGWKYESSVAASMTQHSGGKITHFVAPAGTAGNAISWNTAMDITPSGIVDVGVGATFGNNIHAKFGNNNDLDIYSDNNSSFIHETGSGHLYIRGSMIILKSQADNDDYMKCTENGDVRLYYSNAEKLATTNTGVNVTGEATSSNGTYGTKLTYSGGNQSGIIDTYGNHDLEFRVNNDRAMTIASNGDISFYEDTGTTPKLFWDASAESLGIGTDDPLYLVDLANEGSTQSYNEYIRFGCQNTSGESGGLIWRSAHSNPYTKFSAKIAGIAEDNYFRLGLGFYTGNNADASTNAVERMRIDSSGNVGIGRSPTTDLDLYKSGQDVEMKIEAATASTHSYFTMRNDTGQQLHMRLGGSSVGGTTWAGLSGSKQASLEAQDCTSFTIGTHVAAPIHFVQARTTKAISIDTTGAVTMPAQPAFQVNAASQGSGIATSTHTTVTYNNEVFDQNADFNTTTYVFTAPVTGKYQLNAQVLWVNWDSGASYYYLQVVTSNRTYYDLRSGEASPGDPQYTYGHVHVLADMDAGDTAYVSVYQAGGTVQTGWDNQSIFTGHLVC